MCTIFTLYNLAKTQTEFKLNKCVFILWQILSIFYRAYGWQSYMQVHLIWYARLINVVFSGLISIINNKNIFIENFVNYHDSGYIKWLQMKKNTKIIYRESRDVFCLWCLGTRGYFFSPIFKSIQLKLWPCSIRLPKTFIPKSFGYIRPFMYMSMNKDR